ncbi:MAG: DUF1467 family protein [Rhizobiaceae bacterium]
MSFLTGFAVYFIIWWVTLFMVLPVGVKSQAEEGERLQGTDPGAPVQSRFGMKLVANTLLAGVVFAIWYYLTHVAGFGFDPFPSLFPG